jgi:hypothetical protein
MAHRSIIEEIQRLDPRRDCQRIVYLLTYHEFPFDTLRAVEFALYRTFAIPSISLAVDLAVLASSNVWWEGTGGQGDESRTRIGVLGGDSDLQRLHHTGQPPEQVRDALCRIAARPFGLEPHRDTGFPPVAPVRRRPVRVGHADTPARPRDI